MNQLRFLINQTRFRISQTRFRIHQTRFQQLAEPLRMTSSPSYTRGGERTEVEGAAAVQGGVDPSQGLQISPRDYAEFLRALLAARSVPFPRGVSCEILYEKKIE